jgi:hypothetical protein
MTADMIKQQASIADFGVCIRLARRAANLACEDMRAKGKITNALDSSIMLYTDDPTAAGIFATCSDMAAICKTSAIEGVAIVMGENFPPAAFEAERDDLEYPRVAAMYFPAQGLKCPRCRNFTMISEPTCERCSTQMERIAA